MEKKGLCITCVYDKTCVFSRRFPVLQCEEFSDDGLRGRNKQTKLGSQSTRVRLQPTLQEETIAE